MQARYFKEQDIDGNYCNTYVSKTVYWMISYWLEFLSLFLTPLEFRECFYLFARSGQINNLDELTVSISHGYQRLLAFNTLSR